MMANTDGILDILLALGAGGIIVEGVRSVVQRKKLGADYADVIASSAIKLLEPLEEKVKELEAQQQSSHKSLHETKAELRETKRKLTLTQAELREARNEIRRLTLKILEYERGGRNPHE